MHQIRRVRARFTEDQELLRRSAASTEALLGDGAWHYELAARVLLDG